MTDFFIPTVDVFMEFAGEGVEGLFGGVAAREVKFFDLQIEGALGAVVFLGAKEDGGVAGKVFGGGFATGDLAEGFLTEGDEGGLGNLPTGLADLRDDGVSLIGGAAEATGPAFAGVFCEEGIDL